MTNIRKWVALNATAAVVAATLATFAQDDLDDLLKDLEGGAAKAKPAAAAPADAKAPATAEAAPAAKAEEKAADAAEPAPADSKKVDEVMNLLDELAAEGKPAGKPA